jgi:hypothetical protein
MCFKSGLGPVLSIESYGTRTRSPAQTPHHPAAPTSHPHRPIHLSGNRVRWAMGARAMGRPIQPSGTGADGRADTRRCAFSNPCLPTHPQRRAILRIYITLRLRGARSGCWVTTGMPRPQRSRTPGSRTPTPSTPGHAPTSASYEGCGEGHYGLIRVPL